MAGFCADGDETYYYYKDLHNVLLYSLFSRVKLVGYSAFCV